MPNKLVSCQVVQISSFSYNNQQLRGFINDIQVGTIGYKHSESYKCCSSIRLSFIYYIKVKVRELWTQNILSHYFKCSFGIVNPNGRLNVALVINKCSTDKSRTDKRQKKYLHSLKLSQKPNKIFSALNIYMLLNHDFKTRVID